MTVSLPVIVFADEWEVSHEKLCRSLVVSNLIAIHQKYYIGSLSAYCGAVSAACGAGAGITYMYGGTYQQVSLTIINTLGNIGGIVCDGAKPSCAAKIATSVDAALMAFQLSIQNKSFLRVRASSRMISKRLSKAWDISAAWECVPLIRKFSMS